MSTITCVKRTLANGLRVVAVEMPHLHTAEIAVYIKAGGRSDHRERAGLSHFLEHMLFRGTTDYPSSLELENAFEAIGGSANAATDAESTCYYSRVHPTSIDEGLRLFSSMLLRPTLSGIDLERKIITEEALEDLNERGEEINPDNLASSLLWPEQPLGMPTVGYLSTIAAITEDDLSAHLSRFYLPANAVLVVAGNIAASQVFNGAEAAFGTWKSAPADSWQPVSHVQERPLALLAKNSASQVDLQVAFRSFRRTDSRMTSLRLIRRILSSGGNSRLFLTLRESLGIVYSVDASISAYEETGSFSIDLSCASENLPIAAREVLNEVFRLAAEPLQEEELNRVKRSYLFDLEYSRDSTYELQVRYGWGELMGVRKSIEEDQREIEAISASDIQKAAVELFAPVNLNVIAVGPLKRQDRRMVEKLLAGYETRWKSG